MQTRRVRSWSASAWFIPGLWIVLACLLASLVGLAIFLLVKMDFFSTDSLTDTQLKSVWAFLGVALGAVITLIGTLLTEQHNRRTEALTREAAEREALAKAEQQALAAQAERRLAIDTVAKTLELITTDSGDYAKPARVGGAIATMMELQGGTVAIRMLADLWAADAVGTSTAVWLINRVLTESKDTDELDEASVLLLLNAAKLVPSKEQERYLSEEWPSLLIESWPQHLPESVRNSFFQLAVNVLLLRELAYWQEHGTFPVELLYRAVDDPDHGMGAAFVLVKLHDLGVLQALDREPDEEMLARLAQLSESWSPMPWFGHVVAQFEPWARGEDVRDVAMTTAPLGPAMESDSSSPASAERHAPHD